MIYVCFPMNKSMIGKIEEKETLTMIYKYLYFHQTVHHHNGVNIVLFNKPPEVRLCRKQWHLCEDEFIPSFVSLEYEVHVFITHFTEAVEVYV